MDLIEYLHFRPKPRTLGREMTYRTAWPGKSTMESKIAQIAEFPLTGPSPESGATRRAKLLATLVGLQTGPGKRFVKAVAYVVELAARHDVHRAVRFSLGATDACQCVIAEILLKAADTETSRVSRDDEFANQLNTQLETLRTWVDQVNLSDGDIPAIQLVQSLPTGAVPLTKADVVNWAELLEAKTPTEALIGSQRQVKRISSEFSGVRQKYSELAEQVDRMRSENATWNLLARVASETTNSVVIVGQSGRIEWVNNAFESLTGIAADQAVGESFETLLFDDSDRELATRLRHALRTGQAIIGERSHQRPDGETYWCSFNLSPLRDDNGQLAGWVDIGSDTTAARQAREDLERAMRAAEAASRAKSEFLANMSHEIRTPMNAILGMTELSLGTHLDDQQRDYLTTVKDSAQTLLQILNDILDLSKIEAQRLELEEIDFDLVELLRETMRPLAIQAHAKGLELIWHVPSDVPQQLRGDPTRIRQILTNLVGNAVKFTPQGEVVVTVEKQWASDGEIGLQVSVRDTGVGIPADRLENIFEAFTQGDASTTRQFGGTGLGLTISAELLRLMHGRIRVDSAVGQGSTFSFTVRLALASRTLPPPTPSTTSLVGRRVLVVDDNLTNRRVLTEFLANWEISVVTVESALRAIEELDDADDASRPFDILLLDAVMPENDGFELARRVQHRHRKAPAMIMMLTSTDRAHDVARCHELGVTTYLTKPVSPAALLQAVLAASNDTARRGESPRVAPVEKADRDPPARESELPTKPLHILIADDHFPNRRLAREILSKRGHTFREAESGREVLQRLQDESFDVVLMDVQMPDMDGFETTAAIRRAERATWSHQPIVAVTAYAMKGDREKCLASGMDAYLSKPLDANELVRLVETLADASPDSDHLNLTTAAERPESTTHRIDFRPALQRLAGDETLLKRQMSFFLDEAPKLIAQVRTAIENDQPDTLALAAHRLKGLVSSYDRHEASEIAAQLELASHNRRADIDELAQSLEQHVDDLSAAIQQYLRR